MSIVKQMNDLQELDLGIAQLEKSLSEARARLLDDSALSLARERLTGLDQLVEGLGTKRRSLEQSVARLEERLGAIESRLYGGAVTNPKEFTAAEEERGYIMGQRQEEEDRLLDVMVELEEGEAAQREAQETLARTEIERPAEVADLTRSEEQLSQELAELVRSREQILPLLPAQSLSIYEFLRRTKDGHAVASVERGMCQGCRLTLSTRELQQARSSQSIVQCSSCHRILYVV